MRPFFRFTKWLPAGHDWSSWLSWFRSRGIQAIERRCTEIYLSPEERHFHPPRHLGHTAVFRKGDDSFQGQDFDHEEGAA